MNLKCTMILGDCLNVMWRLPQASVHMLFADLPYGSTVNAWDKCVSFVKFWDAWRHTSRRESDRSIMTATQPFATHLIASNIKNFKHDLVWRKGQATGFLNARKAPLRVHEHVMVFGHGPYNPQMWDAGRNRHGVGTRADGASSYTNSDTPRMSGRLGCDRYPLSVIDMRQRQNKLHPTQKPVDLLDWLIRTYSNAGDNVLDPVSGSGTTAVAALSCGRNVTCIERDEGYFAASVERVRKHCRDNFIRADIEVIR